MKKRSAQLVDTYQLVADRACLNNARIINACVNNVKAYHIATDEIVANNVFSNSVITEEIIAGNITSNIITTH